MAKNISNKCPVCGSDNKEIIKSWSNRTLIGCNACQHMYTINQTTITIDYNAMEMGNTTNKRRISELLSILGKFNIEGKNVLDIGCGTGILMYELNKHFSFSSTSGIEMSKRYHEAINRIDRVYHEDFRQFNTKKQIYDIIFMFHFLEHLENLKDLKDIDNLLTDDGVLFLEVPHRSGSVKIFYDVNASHFQQFSINSITKLLYSIGFEIVYIQTLKYHSARYHDSIFICARKNRGQRPIYHCFQDKNIIKKNDEYIIWGAATPLIEEIMEIIPGSQIKAIVDSNSKLHGNKINDIAISSPEHIKQFNNICLFINSLTHAEDIKYIAESTYREYIKEIMIVSDLLEFT